MAGRRPLIEVRAVGDGVVAVLERSLRFGQAAGQVLEQTAGPRAVRQVPVVVIDVPRTDVLDGDRHARPVVARHDHAVVQAREVAGWAAARRRADGRELHALVRDGHLDAPRRDGVIPSGEDPVADELAGAAGGRRRLDADGRRRDCLRAGGGAPGGDGGALVVRAGQRRSPCAVHRHDDRARGEENKSEQGETEPQRLRL